jgi:uncharacterized integral membrane protein
MDGLRQASEAEPGPAPRSEAPRIVKTPPQDLGVFDAAKRLLDEGREATRSTSATLLALKTLAQAELSLATSAISRAAIMAVGALIAGLVAVFYVFATLSALLVMLGLPWAGALAISTGVLLLIAGVLIWRAIALTKMARFDGTRRQLERIREGTP